MDMSALFNLITLFVYTNMRIFDTGILFAIFNLLYVFNFLTHFVNEMQIIIVVCITIAIYYILMYCKINPVTSRVS